MGRTVKASASSAWFVVAAVTVVTAAGAPAGWVELERRVGVRVDLVDDADGVADLLAADLLAAGQAFGVAHNAGNRFGTAREAGRAGAAVLEVDVVRVGGELRAGRPLSGPSPWRHAFRGPTLGDVWVRVADRPVLQVDLKDGAASTTELLGRFLVERRGVRPVLVSSRSVTQLQELRRWGTGARLLLSIGTSQELRRLRDDPGVARSVDGFTVYEGLLDPVTITELGADGRVVLAWTVNDPRRAARLVRAGVDGIVTDNLAVLRALNRSPPPRPPPPSRTA